MNPGSDCIGRQPADGGDLVVSEPGDFAHDEDVTIDVRQSSERFVHSEADVLGRRPRDVSQYGWFKMSLTRAVMIQREIPGDAEEPGPHAAFVDGSDSGSAYTDEYVLGQVAGNVRLSYRSAEIPEEPVVVRGEQRLRIAHASYLRTSVAGKTLARDGHDEYMPRGEHIPEDGGNRSSPCVELRARQRWYCIDHFCSAAVFGVLEIARRQTGSFRDSIEHLWPNLVIIMKREHEIGPVQPRKGPM